MASKDKILTDEDILTKLEAKVKGSVGYSESRLSRERERVIKYYNSQLPAQANKGSASYISTDVYDSVEAMKAQLLETFCGNQDDLISFPPQGADDVVSSRIATDYCSYVVFRENDGYTLCNDVIDDGLKARVGIAKVFWEEIYEHEDEEIKDASYDDVQGVAAQEDVTDLEADADEATGLFSGTLRRRYDKSKVTIMAIPPDEFGISRNATTVKEADLTYHRTLKSKAELKAMGYDPVKVDQVNSDEANMRDGEKQAREWMTDGYTAEDDDPIQPDLEKVWLYEAYVKMDIGKGVKLYKVCFANNTLFDKQEVYCAPFKVFTPLPIPHVFLGNNFAARVIPTQNARTVLTRAILDHTTVTTNPRWQVVQGGLLNPKEMLDNRKGGLVNVKRQDAIKALEQANLNPFVFQTLEMLKANKEESTGISALSQGLNKEAISTQNSQGLVSDLVTLSQQRQKIIARNFSKFLVEVYLEVYRLVLENENKEKIVQIAGDWVPVTPDQWRERSTCKVSVNLGYGDREKETQKFASTHQLLRETAGPMYTPENQFNLITDGLKSAGFKDHARYLTDPSKLPPPEPDPLKVRELDIKDKQAEASKITAMATQAKVQNTAAYDSIKAQLEELKAHVTMLTNTRDADRKDREVDNRIEISEREMALAENPPEGVEGKSIISPSG
jgi:hypothetical protein